MIATKKIITSILFFLISFVCMAQMPPPPPDGPPGPVGLPIDNGVIVLLIAGVLFGIYKIYNLQIKKT